MLHQNAPQRHTRQLLTQLAHNTPFSFNKKNLPSICNYTNNAELTVLVRVFRTAWCWFIEHVVTHCLPNCLQKARSTHTDKNSARLIRLFFHSHQQLSSSATSLIRKPLGLVKRSYQELNTLPDVQPTISKAQYWKQLWWVTTHHSCDSSDNYSNNHISRVSCAKLPQNNRRSQSRGLSVHSRNSH